MGSLPKQKFASKEKAILASQFEHGFPAGFCLQYKGLTQANQLDQNMVNSLMLHYNCNLHRFSVVIKPKWMLIVNGNPKNVHRCFDSLSLTQCVKRGQGPAFFGLC